VGVGVLGCAEFAIGVQGRKILPSRSQDGSSRGREPGSRFLDSLIETAIAVGVGRACVGTTAGGAVRMPLTFAAGLEGASGAGARGAPTRFHAGAPPCSGPGPGACPRPGLSPRGLPALRKALLRTFASWRRRLERGRLGGHGDDVEVSLTEFGLDLALFVSAPHKVLTIRISPSSTPRNALTLAVPGFLEVFVVLPSIVVSLTIGRRAARSW